ncbi:MAG: DUF503 domain-containing protein, partial [Candidatus Sulfotelmatobacter sp.]
MRHFDLELRRHQGRRCDRGFCHGENCRGSNCLERVSSFWFPVSSVLNENWKPETRSRKLPLIAFLTLELHIEAAQSLKDKRQVVRSLKDRLRASFNISVAELDPSPIWNRATIGVV